MISAIIPVYNEEEVLLRHGRRFQELGGHAELIFVDGGSCDKTAQVASGLGRLISAPKGRAAQMNRGAQEAKGDILFFLHADSFIAPQGFLRIKESIAAGAVGGCCTQKLSNRRPIYRKLEEMGNKRAKNHKIFYGDQGIFVKKDIFFECGGFPDVAVMEDVLFSSSLKKKGRVVVLDELIHVSARRWERHGFFRTNAIYATINLLFLLKVPLSLIKRLYRDLR